MNTDLRFYINSVPVLLHHVDADDIFDVSEEDVSIFIVDHEDGGSITSETSAT
jgi:hypothetical protein